MKKSDFIKNISNLISQKGGDKPWSNTPNEMAVEVAKILETHNLLKPWEPESDRDLMPLDELIDEELSTIVPIAQIAPEIKELHRNIRTIKSFTNQLNRVANTRWIEKIEKRIDFLSQLMYTEGGGIK